MANTSSAKRAIRQIERRTEINKSRRSRARTFIKQVEEALASGDSKVARLKLGVAESELMKAAQKGAFNKKMASRKVSRLTHRVKSLETASTPAHS